MMDPGRLSDVVMSVALWNESKILSRLMYKVRNQHRSSRHYHCMQQVFRHLRALLRLELALGDAKEGGQRPVLLSEVTKLLEVLQRCVTRAFTVFQGLYVSTYFVPLSVTGMALMSRIWLLCSTYTVA